MTDRLKAPFPWFGGKSRVAALVWDRLGDIDNAIEPFCGSAAFLLARPHAPRVETINDADCYVANFWRATARDPEAVAEHADWPVNEADLHARHRWLVLSEEAAAFRKRMRRDPEYYDARIAGWWCWGLCCWIGGGWCKAPEDMREGDRVWTNTQNVPWTGKGVTAGEARRPVIANPGSSAGKGINGNPPAKMPGAQKSVAGMDAGHPEDVRHWAMNVDSRGIHAAAGGRPQLADAYARGRGVHGHDEAGTCEQRRQWLVGWFGRLRDRLRTVRVCCGDWLRVCDSESVTTRLGITGIFFDPPYSAEAGRDMNLYATESGDVAHAVRRYCLERGTDKRMRICLAGYAGEGHEELEAAGWDIVAWKAQGGYGNRSKKGKDNAGRERLWFSPYAQKPRSLFDGLMKGAGP